MMVGGEKRTVPGQIIVFEPIFFSQVQPGHHDDTDHDN